MWKPWIGPDYQPRRLLLLGESCYDWPDDTTGERVNADDHDMPTEIVRCAMADPRTPSHTIRIITRAICGTATPSPAQSAAAWKTVAYTNFVPTSVGLGAGQPPTAAQWRRACAEWQQILDAVEPRLVIVFGYTMWGYMDTTDPDVSQYVGGFRSRNGKLAMAWAAPHPAARTPRWAWPQYAAYIAQAQQDRTARPD